MFSFKDLIFDLGFASLKYMWNVFMQLCTYQVRTLLLYLAWQSGKPAPNILQHRVRIKKLVHLSWVCKCTPNLKHYAFR